MELEMEYSQNSIYRNVYRLRIIGHDFYLFSRLYGINLLVLRVIAVTCIINQWEWDGTRDGIYAGFFIP